MSNGSRGLRETVIRALAKVGLVWALAVLGALFMAVGSHGQDDDGGYSLASGASPGPHGFAFSSGEAPRTAGLALALVVLAGGATVLVIGATRGERDLEPELDAPPEPAGDLSLAVGLGLPA